MSRFGPCLVAAAPASPPATSLGGAAEHLALSSRACWPRRAPLDELLHDSSVPVAARGGEALRR